MAVAKHIIRGNAARLLAAQFRFLILGNSIHLPSINYNVTQALFKQAPTPILGNSAGMVFSTGLPVTGSFNGLGMTLTSRRPGEDTSKCHLKQTTRDGLRRFRDELIRMQEFTHRVLFLEGDPLSLTRTRDCNPAVIRDILLSTLAEHRVELMMLPCSTANARNHAAEWLASRLIFGAMQCPPPPPPMSSSVKTA